MRGVFKSFPGVQALRGVDLDLRAGEVLAVLGENGAGKSTLIKILGGAHRPDTGTISVAGEPVPIHSPVDAQRAGISIIYQEFNLIPALSARENIFLGRERLRFGLLRQKEESRQARELFSRLGVEIEPDVPCRDLSVAQQQLVEIAKALSLDARILVMDEPSATLTPPEVERLFAIIRDLRAQGLGLIYISHRLEEIFAIADRVLVLRDGQLVGTKAIGDVTRGELIEMMVGRKLEQEFPKRTVRPGNHRLVVRNLCRGPEGARCVVHDSAWRGAGPHGTGGCGSHRSGPLPVRGRPRRLRHDRTRRPAAHHPPSARSDPRRAGAAHGRPQGPGPGARAIRARELRAAESARGSRVCAWSGRRPNGALLPATSRACASAFRTRSSSRATSPAATSRRWFWPNGSSATARSILFDEPTRGIDVGAKFEVHQLINELAAQGKAILMISSELPEVLGMSDRILVMHGGRIVGEVTDVARATQEDIMHLAVG